MMTYSVCIINEQVFVKILTFCAATTTISDAPSSASTSTAPGDQHGHSIGPLSRQDGIEDAHTSRSRARIEIQHTTAPMFELISNHNVTKLLRLAAEWILKLRRERHDITRSWPSSNRYWQTRGRPEKCVVERKAASLAYRRVEFI